MNSPILALAQAAQAFLVALGLLLPASSSAGTQDREFPWMGMDQSMLQIVVNLASDTAAVAGADRELLFYALYTHLAGADLERIFAEELITADPEHEFAAVVAAEGNLPLDYLVAARRSYARLKTAESAGDRDWISKHNTAAKKYVGLAVEALRRQATENENAAAKLETERFAVRRPADEAERFLEQLKRDGLSAEHRKLLGESGLTAEEIAAYQRMVQATPAAEIGISMVELYRKIAEARRELAAALEKFAQDHRWVSGPMSDSFLVGNPHEREAVVQLVVRRVAMPPEWTVSLSEAQPAAGEKPAQRLKEVEKGRRYEVRLPSKGEIRVVSEVTPVGVMAENTTARWAIEGRIGEELLGGIVQEVNVPGFLPDLQLPPIAPPSQPTAGAPSVWRNNLLWMIIAGLLLALAIAVVVLRARKRA